MKLEVLCDTKSGSWARRSPFGYWLDGERVDVAMNGAAIVVAPGHRYAVPDHPLPVEQFFSVSVPVHASTRLSALREWALPRSEPRKERCTNCGGSGKVSHDCGCDHCAWQGLDKCDACRGEGHRLGHTPPAAGLFIGKMAIDRRLLGAVLESIGEAADCDVKVEAEERTTGLVRLSIGSVTAFIMTMRYDENDEGPAAAAFPGWADRTD